MLTTQPLVILGGDSTSQYRKYKQPVQRGYSRFRAYWS